MRNRLIFYLRVIYLFIERIKTNVFEAIEKESLRIRKISDPVKRESNKRYFWQVLCGVC